MAEQATGPTRTDVLLAAGCAGVTLLGLVVLPALADTEPDVVSLPEAGGLAWWAALATLVAQAATLAWRRQRPDVVAGVAAAAVPVGAVVGMGPAIGLTSLAVLIAVYTLGTQRRPSQAWPLLTVVGIVVAIGHGVAGLDGDVSAREAAAAAILQAVVLVVTPLAVAALVVTRRESRAAREDRLRALEREHEALVRAAVDRERTAMARELHDIAAHHLTGIALMSAAIATQIDTDPAGAKEAVGEVRRESTAVLRDLRSLVGLMRDQDRPAAEGVRLETLAGVSGLVDDALVADQDVTLAVLSAPDGRALGSGVGPLAQLAAYRTVQESLSNAGRHAPGALCEVEVDDRDPAALVVTVRNAPTRQVTGPEARGGLGLVGMQERAELTGSHLDVGPTSDGGWEVRLRVPRSDPADAGEAS